MNFGFRLPGPFRVSVSSKGRVSVGASMGPFSVSTSSAARAKAANPGGEPGVVVKGTVAGLVAQAVSEGWTVTGQEPHAALLRRGRDRARIDQVSPTEVRVAPTATRTTALVLALLLGIPTVMCYLWLKLH